MNDGRKNKEGFSSLSSIHQVEHRKGQEIMETHASGEATRAHILIEALKTEIECPICFSSMETALDMGPCAHKIDEACARKYFGEPFIEKPCPICRKIVKTLSQDHTLRAIAQIVKQAEKEGDQEGPSAKKQKREIPQPSCSEEDLSRLCLERTSHGDYNEAIDTANRIVDDNQQSILLQSIATEMLKEDFFWRASDVALQMRTLSKKNDLLFSISKKLVERERFNDASAIALKIDSRDLRIEIQTLINRHLRENGRSERAALV